MATKDESSIHLNGYWASKLKVNDFKRVLRKKLNSWRLFSSSLTIYFSTLKSVNTNKEMSGLLSLFVDK